MAVETPAAETHLLRAGPAQLSQTLSYLYFARTAAAVVWLVSLSAALGQKTTLPFRPLVWTLLIAYPVIDAGATLADIRMTPVESQTRFQRLNLAASLLAAIAVAATTRTSNFSITIGVVGGWAISSGAIQLVVAVRRRSVISAQWFMIVSGAGSIFAGVNFLGWAGTARDGVAALVQYSAGGALWYAVAAVWLLASTRRLTSAHRTSWRSSR
ncbi:MAG TPA: hypothetical protein VHX15_00485 [Frankiaceae bacterium]|jgi:hypothetical protein|nr:hypothetical protein [Frankiaceae bacterium]